MKTIIVKYGFIFALLLGSTNLAEAQRKGRAANTGNRGQQTTAPAVVKDTIPPVIVPETPTANVPVNVYGDKKIVMAPQAGGFNDTVLHSLRNDGATEKGFINERTPLPYENLRAEDALYSQRVWREIDIREKINMPFRNQSNDDNGDQRLVSILVDAVRKGAVTAFSADDDRFTTPLDSITFANSLGGGGACDTLPVYNLLDPTKIDSFVVTCDKLSPDDIVKFRIKEDWIFDREASRLFVRIIGIAPCKTQFALDKKTERGVTPLFWIYYPDLRPTLAKYEVYNSKNMGMSKMTWEELFESRMFSSYIIKSTLDNPLNKYIRNVIKDPILALLEGENIKNKIFDYEQNLWSY